MNLNFPRFIVLMLAAILCSNLLWAQFQYVNPKPNSKMHHLQTGIILRNGNLIDSTSLLPSLFSVVGSASGSHNLKIILSDDGKTVILQPIVVFARGETVTVTVKDGMKTTGGQVITGTTFSFEIGDTGSPETVVRMQNALTKIHEDEFGAAPLMPQSRVSNQWKQPFPPFSIWTNTNPTAGQIFFHNFSFSFTGTSHYCIIQNNGDSVYGRYDTVKGNNFYLNHNGYLTMYNDSLMDFQILDSNYNSIDTFKMRNGYRADVHEFQVFPNGHSYMVCYDAEPFDMTIYNNTYNPDAIVTGAVVQELDKNRNVVFEWRSWDYFQVTDDTHDPLSTSTIDYVHLNAIVLDNDNNIIISCRHMDEVTKIDHTTGNLIWRWGGKNNQFTFVGDPIKFSHQHDVERIANGHITMFDNGNYHMPSQSYAKEYQLDEVNKVATLVWKYQRITSVGPVYGNAMGSVQRLSNGNTLIDWGLIYVAQYPTATEIDSNQNIVWEMRLDDTYNDAIYRIHKFNWDPCSRPTTSTMKASSISSTQAKVSWGPATHAVSYEVSYRLQGARKWKIKNTPGLSKVLQQLMPGKTYEWRLRSSCTDPAGKSAYTPIKTFNTLSGKEDILPANLENDVSIYPNPNNGSFEIQMSLDEEGPVQIQIYDVTGRVVYSLNQTMNAGDETLAVNLNQAIAGVYIAEVKTTTGRMVKKLIVE